MNAAQRAALVESHRHLVRKAAALIYPRVREHVDMEELIGLGDLGLVEAASRYDPDAGASFSTFAWYRVQGSVIDGLRRASNLPRRVWAQLCALRAAAEVLEARGRQEAAARAAGAPGAGAGDTEARLREVRDAIAAVQTVYTVSLATMEEHQEPADPGEPADARLDRAAMRRQVEAAMTTLPERERALLHKHYVEGKNLMEAGAELGISKSWASRLHAQAVERLRARLASDGDG
ncbi:MAG: sigma-70 family RNA polymerase sigma factor [Kofleriaceae bacterium]|nr:sigma-70 family RNA polymerase sigma factor [Kofleriaceae bacterium]MCB9574793.1 sigma-70 family RNA polymerase sigma factor [Kofleriaceae bacterium]